MTDIIRSIDEILAEEELVIADTGAENREHSHWFSDHMYDSKVFSHLDLDKLISVSECILKKKDIFAHPKVITVDKVASEIGDFMKIIHNKRNAMQNYSSHLSKAKKYSGCRYESDTMEVEQLFDQICNSVYDLSKIARGKIFIPAQKDLFEILEKMALVAGKKPGIKIDYGERYNRTRTNEKEVDLHTDERVISVAFYKSLVDREPSCVITSDSDLYRLACVIKRELVNSNKQNRAKLSETPFKIYYLNEGINFNLAFDSAYNYK